MVAVGGNSGRHSAANNLGVVKLLASGISAGHKNPADGVAGAVPEPSFARLIETWVLTKHNRQHGAGEIVFDGAIGEVGGITLAIPGRTLPVSRFAVFRLADARQETVPGNLNVVERASGYHPEFLPGGEGWNVLSFHGKKVRQGVEKPVIRRASFFLLFYILTALGCALPLGLR